MDLALDIIKYRVLCSYELVFILTDHYTLSTSLVLKPEQVASVTSHHVIDELLKGLTCTEDYRGIFKRANSN